MIIALINESKMISNTDAATMAAACQMQLTNDVLPAWNIRVATIEFFADKTQVPANAWVVNLLDNPTQTGALGYHSVDDDLIDAFVFAEPVLQNGGVVLYDPANPQNVSVSSVLSHEICEMAADVFAASYSDNGTGQSWALEISDPVQNGSYCIVVNGINVSVSDFVYPAFFNSESNAKDAPFNHLNTLKAAFTIEAGGYAIVRTCVGNEQQVFGDAIPEWLKEQKKTEFSRFARRTK